MYRNDTFVECSGFVAFLTPAGTEIKLPVFVGVLKHLRKEELFALLTKPDVAKKYTQEALKIAPWQVLKLFPSEWLKSELIRSNVRQSRKQAIEFLIG